MWLGKKLYSGGTFRHTFASCSWIGQGIGLLTCIERVEELGQGIWCSSSLHTLGKHDSTGGEN